MDVRLMVELARLQETSSLLGDNKKKDTAGNEDFMLCLTKVMESVADSVVSQSSIQAQSPAVSVSVPASGSSGTARWRDLIDRASSASGVDPALLQAVMETESGGNAAATSCCGAEGLMQLMPGTAVSLGVSNPYDPAQNILGGARYLKMLIDHYGGNVSLALAAYNSGPGTLSRLGVSDWGQDSWKLPQETRAYVPKVLALYNNIKSGA